ncbi:MAG: DUF423 domain-containing protein [Gemmatimonadaceae bacterium]
MTRLFFFLGAVSAALAVAAGAFGAHALRARLEPAMLDVFETAARFQMYHALALLAVAWAAERWRSALTAASGWLLIIGTILFCGSLYGMALSGMRALGAITPIGGACFIAGWACLALAAIRRNTLIQSDDQR